MNNVGISVVLATYNGEKYLTSQLKSVINQSYAINEIIIVDDQSKDNTIKIINEFQKEYPNIKLYQNEVNIGAIGSFQKAASLTKTDYIAFCDQDDIWELDKLEKQMNLLSKMSLDNKQPLLVFHDLTLIDTNDKVITPSFLKMLKINSANFSFEKLLFSNFITGCTCIINNSMKDKFLETNIKNIMMHDHWFALIAFSFGKVLFIDETLMKYRSHSQSVTSKEKLTVFSRINNICKTIFCSNDNYIVKNIKQAEEFNLMFKNELTVRQQQSLDEILNLKGKSYLRKFIRPYFRFKLFNKRN